MLTERPYSYLVDSLLPEYIKTDFPIYAKFIKEFFSALESDSGPVAVVNSITKYIDVTRIPAAEVGSIVNQYLHSFPVDDFENLDIRQFIQNSKTFYSKKGTQDSLQFVFNLLGGTLEVYYPSDDIFHLNTSNLSGTHKLHDNVYYAYYVYEIRTDLDISQYQEIVETLIHPIGTKVFYVQTTGV
jgi:hypothetical protein